MLSRDNLDANDLSYWCVETLRGYALQPVKSWNGCWKIIIFHYYLLLDNVQLSKLLLIACSEKSMILSFVSKYDLHNAWMSIGKIITAIKQVSDPSTETSPSASTVKCWNHSKYSSSSKLSPPLLLSGWRWPLTGQNGKLQQIAVICQPTKTKTVQRRKYSNLLKFSSIKVTTWSSLLSTYWTRKNSSKKD